jgi:hypothetical protein
MALEENNVEEQHDTIPPSERQTWPSEEPEFDQEDTQ